jgi:hypothetical protein
MRNILPILLVALAVATASPARARNFAPPEATFTAEGFMALTSRRSVTCAAHLRLSTGDKNASITAAAFTGYQCATIRAAQLPWRVTSEPGGFDGFHPILIHGLALLFVHGATCGPADIRARLNPHGRILFKQIGIEGTTPCSIDVGVSTTPHLGVEGD